MTQTQRESRMGRWRGREPSPRVKNPLRLGVVVAAATLGLTLTVSGLGAQSPGLIGIRTAALAVPDATAQPAPSPTIATAVKLENGADRAKLTFDLSQPITATAFVLAAPYRVVVDLPEIDFRVDPEAGGRATSVRSRPGMVKASGLISSFRFGLFAPGKSRIVIDLAGPARILRAAAEPAFDRTSSRLVIELAKTDRAAFQAAAHDALLATAEAAQGAGSAVPVEESSGRRASLPVIVIDPGHGGVDSGAMVNRLIEKNIVFDFAKTLADKLRAGGRYKVIMTRNSDVFLALGERVRIARDSGAALFVSIHADTLSDATSVAGATVYTVSDRATDAEAARIAEKENQADATAGVEGNDETSSVSDILSDLTRQETRAYSHVFARTLVNYWKVAGRLNKNPERAAGFLVLKAPDVPSVLIELGYLSNPKDAASLVSAEWRDATSSKVAAAIDAFFAARGGDQFDAKEAPSVPAATAQETLPAPSVQVK